MRYQAIHQKRSTVGRNTTTDDKGQFWDHKASMEARKDHKRTLFSYFVLFTFLNCLLQDKLH